MVKDGGGEDSVMKERRPKAGCEEEVRQLKDIMDHMVKCIRPLPEGSHRRRESELYLETITRLWFQATEEIN